MINVKEYLARTFRMVINLFRKYPLTLIIVVCLTLFLTTFTNTSVFKSTTLENVTIFGVMWTIGTIFIETLNLKNQKNTVIFYVLAAIISFIFVKLPQNVYGLFNEHITRIMTGYGLILILLSMYVIIKKENITFQEYVLKIFNNTFNSTITYGIVNIGMTLIIVIFTELILDGRYGEILFKSQILLLAFSINLAKNEFLDVISYYLRFTDKYFFQRKRQRLKENRIHCFKYRCDFLPAATHGQCMQLSSFFILHNSKSIQYLLFSLIRSKHTLHFLDIAFHIL